MNKNRKIVLSVWDREFKILALIKIVAKDTRMLYKVVMILFCMIWEANDEVNIGEYKKIFKCLLEFFSFQHDSSSK